MTRCIGSDDFARAQALYARIRPLLHFKVNIDTAHMFVAICDRLSRTEALLQTVQDLRESGVSLTQPVYCSLVRLHCEGGRTDEAWAAVEEMQREKVPLRLRVFQPILEAALRDRDVRGALRAMQYIAERGIAPRAEQIAVLLETYAAAVRAADNADADSSSSSSSFSSSSCPTLSSSPAAAVLKDKEVREEVRRALDVCLSRATAELLLLKDEDLRRVAHTLCGVSPEALQAQGVLVHSLEDVNAPIISDATLERDGSVVALNATHATVEHINSNTISDSTARESAENNSLPFFSTQKYVVRDYLDRVAAQQRETPSHTDTQEDVVREKALPARLVHVSNALCRCPHCDGEIQSIQINEEQKREVRDALVKMASEQSAEHTKYLEEFADWLRARPEFDYIVDGPNVAYQNQNHFFGRFSYKQIDLMVKKLKEMGKRPLVILPSSYSLGVNMIHNSIRRNPKMKKVVLTDSEKQILQRLEDEGLLYTVPRGANDDWYWMYSTLYPGRETPAHVVTNDLMRDHRLSFFAPTSFVRWRSSQIVYYSILRHYNQSVMMSDVLGLDAGNKTGVGLPSFHDVDVDGDVFLMRPGNFSKEIQKSPSSHRWHLPSADSNMWLCVNTNTSST